MSFFSQSVDWDFPVPIHYGPGRITELSSICDYNGIRRPLIVTDRGSRDLPFLSLARKILDTAGFAVNVFTDISPNPIDKEIMMGKSVFEEGKHDAVIAIGGGSGMDGGKAISLVSNNNYKLWDFDNDKTEVKDISIFPSLICIPTTSGTGAETESTAMVTNRDLGMKLCVWHPNQKPVAALLDPELTLDLPKNLTAWTGIDALVHAIESYCINSLHSVADGMALEALNLIGNNLELVIKNPTDIQSRGAMLIGSCLAGISFKKGLGLVHAISHMVGAIYNTQHGLTNAILLPAVLRFNKVEISHKIETLNYVTFSKPGNFYDFYNNICNLLDNLEILSGLEGIGVKKEKVLELAKKASKDSAAKTNPRLASVAELENLIIESLSRAR